MSQLLVDDIVNKDDSGAVGASKGINVSGIATLGFATATTFNAGVGTFSSSVYVLGDLEVSGDISYDEVTATNAKFTGIATVGSGVTISIAGVHASSGIVTAASLKYGSTDVETAINTNSTNIATKASTGKAIAMAMVFG